LSTDRLVTGVFFGIPEKKTGTSKPTWDQLPEIAVVSKDMDTECPF